MPEPQATPSFADDLARLRGQPAPALSVGGDFAADLAKLRATGPVAQTIPASAIGHPQMIPRPQAAPSPVAQAPINLGPTAEAPAGSFIDPKTGAIIRTPVMGEVPILDAPYVGIPRVAKGVKALAAIPGVPRTQAERDVVYRAVSDVVQGIFKTAEPLAVGGLIGAPIRVGTIIVAAMLAGKGGHEAAALAGGSPAAQDAAGDVAALMAGGWGAKRLLSTARGGVRTLANEARALRARAEVTEAAAAREAGRPPTAPAVAATPKALPPAVTEPPPTVAVRPPEPAPVAPAAPITPSVPPPITDLVARKEAEVRSGALAEPPLVVPPAESFAADLAKVREVVPAEAAATEALAWLPGDKKRPPKGYMGQISLPGQSHQVNLHKVGNEYRAYSVEYGQTLAALSAPLDRSDFTLRRRIRISAAQTDAEYALTEQGQAKFAGLATAESDATPPAAIRASAPAVGKEPWEMTRREYRQSLGHDPNQHHVAADAAHGVSVADAVALGKPVPPEVLADYPDLTRPEELAYGQPSVQTHVAGTPSHPPEGAKVAPAGPRARRRPAPSGERSRLPLRATDDPGDALLTDAHARAIEQGFAGSIDDLRPHFNKVVEDARAFTEEMREIEHEHGDTAALRAIARVGGLGQPSAESTYPEVVRAFWEASTGTRDMGPKKGRPGSRAVKYLPNGSVGGVSGVVRWGGKDFDTILEALQEDGFDQYQDIADLEALLGRITSNKRAQPGEVGDLTDLARTIRGMTHGPEWWGGTTPTTTEPEAVPDWVTEPETPAVSTIAPRPATLKRKPPKTPTAEQIRAEVYQVGAIVKSYFGQDRIIAYHPPDATGRWSVEVIAVKPDGSPIPGERVRVHGTEPERVDKQTALMRLRAKQQESR